MVRRNVVLVAGALAIVLATVVAGFAAGTGVMAQTGTIALTVQCSGNPELTTIGNNTDQPLNLAGFLLTSIDQPRPGVEPFTLSGTLAPNTSVIYRTGSNAPAGDPTTLTRQSIYDNTAPNEGARLTTPFGTLEVLCSVGAGALPVTGGQPLPTMAPTPTVVATLTPAPTATIPATVPPAPTSPAEPTVPLATATAPAPPPTAMPTIIVPTATVAPPPTATAVPTATPTMVMPGLPATGAGGSAVPAGLLIVFASAAALLVGALAIVATGARRARRGAMRR